MNYLKKMKSKLMWALVVFSIIGIILTICSFFKNTNKEVMPINPPSTTQKFSETTTESISEEETKSDVIESEIISLGKYRLTAYCGCSKCCGKWGENRPIDEHGNPIVYTANQSVARQGVTVAADTNVLPYGTEIIIDNHRYVVQDRGVSVNENCIDIYFSSHEDALNFGVQYKEVFIEKRDNNENV